MLLRLMVENIMTQWMLDWTGYSGQDKLSWLDLIFTMEVNVIENIYFNLPIGRSDCLVIRFWIQEGKGEVRKEEHKVGRYNF